MKPLSEIQLITEVFSQHRDEVKAVQMKVYMKDMFPFLGIQSPLRAELSKPFLSLTFEDEAHIRSLVRQLWRLAEREYQYLAIEMIYRKKRFWTEDWLDMIEGLIVNKSWWDTVDGLAAKIIGPFFLRFPELKQERIEKWIASDDMWLNRSAIIFQLKYKNDVDTHLLTASILPHINSKEFFLEKAIGWALRQYSKFNQEWVRNFLQEYELRPLSVREATKYL